MNRKFVRISLGGVRDEAEIRGHRRTYIGAMPGRIVQALKQAGSANPVFMLDEIDKMSVGFQGDPAAALLEVLDPAQNNTFRDHYLEMQLRPLARAVHRDGQPARHRAPARCSTGWRSSRSPATPRTRSIHIARRYLIPRQIAEHGLPAGAVDMPDAALRRGHRASTRARPACATSNARSARSRARWRPAWRPASATPAMPAGDASVDAATCAEYLGPPRIHGEVAFRTSRPGVATGVAWTETGGDVLFIEATLLPGGHEQT